MPIRLIPQDPGMLRALQSPVAFLETYGVDVSSHLETARGVVEQSLDFARRVGAQAPWSGYLALQTDSSTIVGCCGFKGNPAGDATVEIAYYTFPDYEGRGLATGMAQELVEIARRERGVRTVVAHTLARSNASTRILSKIGFLHVGEVIDPDDGKVWRWRLPLTNG